MLTSDVFVWDLVQRRPETIRGFGVVVMDQEWLLTSSQLYASRPQGRRRWAWHQNQDVLRIDCGLNTISQNQANGPTTDRVFQALFWHTGMQRKYLRWFVISANAKDISKCNRIWYIILTLCIDVQLLLAGTVCSCHDACLTDDHLNPQIYSTPIPISVGRKWHVRRRLQWERGTSQVLLNALSKFATTHLTS